MGDAAAAARSAASAADSICHQLTPAINTTNTPLAATKIAVPKSGWTAIAAAGKAIMSSATTATPRRGGSPWRTIHAATTKGIAIFMISEGCRHVLPHKAPAWRPVHLACMAILALNFFFNYSHAVMTDAGTPARPAYARLLREAIEAGLVSAADHEAQLVKRQHQGRVSAFLF